MTGIARFSLVALDCRDPQALATFYSAVTGWPIKHDGGDWVQLGSETGATIAFQRHRITNRRYGRATCIPSSSISISTCRTWTSARSKSWLWERARRNPSPDRRFVSSSIQQATRSASFSIRRCGRNRTPMI
jgi:hypothetical protein